MKRSEAQKAHNARVDKHNIRLHQLRRVARRKESESFITAAIDPELEEDRDDSEPGSLFERY